VNVVHLSDHGMDSLELSNVIDLTKFIDGKQVKFYGTTPVLQIVPENSGDVDFIYTKLQAVAVKNGHFKVYTNEELPDRWHFHNKYRVGPLTVVADLGYGFQDMFASAEWYKKVYNIPITPTTMYGVHGYDNAYESMHPIFFAYGHMIKAENVVQPFDTVDLFYLFCEILGLEPPSYLKGSRDNILGVLKESKTERLSRWMVLTISIIASVVIVSTLMLALRYFRHNRSSVPSYLYEEDTTILDDTKLPNYSINSMPTPTTYPSTSTFLVA